MKTRVAKFWKAMHESCVTSAPLNSPLVKFIYSEKAKHYFTNLPIFMKLLKVS